MIPRRHTSWMLLMVAPALLALATPTRAAVLSLTNYGTLHGFTLSTFIYGLPKTLGRPQSPYGMGLRPDGKVLVATSEGNILIFPSDADMQTSAPVGYTYGYDGADCIAQIQQGGT